MAETISGYTLATWYGIYAPKRTPAHRTTAELEAYIRSETERWRKVSATAGIRME